MLKVILTAAAAAVTFAQAPTQVIQLNMLAHTAESLEKTVPFYRDVLGLPPAGANDPLQAQPQKLNEEMSKFTATNGMSFRGALFRIPNSPVGVELTEFTGAPRKAVRPNLQDIGAMTLVIQVRDIEAVLTRVRKSGAQIVTRGGAPVNPTGDAKSRLREILLRDPDGFFVELQQPANIPAAAANTPGDVIGGGVQLSVGDAEKTAIFLRDAIGYNARPTGALATNALVAQLIGLPGAQWRITHGSITGTALDIALIEYVGPQRAKVAGTAHDPGSPAITLVVRDITAAVDQWVKAGGTVASTGGKAIVQANGAGNVFVRDINGLMWEFIQRARPAN